MGGSDSIIKKYIKQYGLQAVFNYVQLRKKTDWLQGQCTLQFHRKIDQKVKYIIRQLDESINKRKRQLAERYKKTKLEILQENGENVKEFEERNKHSIESAHGKDQLFEKLNMIKVNFHIEAHIIKKKVKQATQQKLLEMSLDILQGCQISIAKQMWQTFLTDEKEYQKLMERMSHCDLNMESFKKDTISSFDFDRLFWTDYDNKIREAQRQIDGVCSEATTHTDKMKKAFSRKWNLFI